MTILQTEDVEHRVRIVTDDRGRYVVRGCGPERIWDSLDSAVADAAARIPEAERQAAIINSLLPEVPQMLHENSPIWIEWGIGDPSRAGLGRGTKRKADAKLQHADGHYKVVELEREVDTVDDVAAELERLGNGWGWTIVAIAWRSN